MNKEKNHPFCFPHIKFLRLVRGVYYILLIVLTSISTACYGQSKRYLKLNRYDTYNGLGSSNVRKILQDPKGFTWLATQDGLYRFDGKQFVGYNKGFDLKHYLSGSDVRDIAISGDKLWAITSFGGIDCIDIITGNSIYSWTQQSHANFDTVLLSSLSIVSDNIYIGASNGLYKFRISTKMIEKIKLSSSYIPSYLENSNITSTVIDRSGYLWLFSANVGLTVLDTTDLKPVAFFEDKIWTYSSGTTNTNYIITGTSNGLRTYKISNSQIKIFPNFSEKITGSQYEDVYAVGEDKYGGIWFSNKTSLIKFHPFSRAYDVVEERIPFKEENWTGSVFNIYFDKKGYLWLGCQQGLAFSDLLLPKFISIRKSTNSSDVINHSYFLYPLNDSVVYACAENGLYKVNFSTGSIKTIDEGKPYFYVFTDFRGNLITSASTGSFLVNSEKLVNINTAYKELAGISPLMINSHISIGDSLYIFGTQNKRGIYIWDYKKKKILNISQNTNALRLKDNVVNTIYKSKSGLIWILSDNSVMIFDNKKNLMTPLAIATDSINKLFNIFFDICETSNNYFLASYGNGIIVLDKELHFKKLISTENGLSNNGVYKLFAFNDSLLIATTNNGLSIINLNNDQIKKYYKESGLHSNAFEELSGNSRKGLLYAGGAGGFTIINPENFKVNSFPPLLYITNIQIKTKSFLVDTSDLNIKSIKISNQSIQTTLFFSSINYIDPLRTTISYKIKELNSDWVDIGNTNTLPLIGLGPGTYHLQVQAFNEDGVPSEIKELTLVFLPKWYQTWLFKLLLVLLAMGIVYSIYRVRINQLKKEQQIKTRLASDLHDDLGSTMNSVKVYTNLALMETEQEKYLLKIKEGTHEAITGIKDMIWVLDDSKGSMEDLLARVSLFAASLCEANKIRYKSEITDEARNHKLGQEERRNLYMMMKEAVNNAIKYADASQVIIDISVKKGKPDISIKDDGKGFDTGKTTEGNGLKNMNRRAKEIKFYINIRSAPGKGTTINFQKI